MARTKTTLWRRYQYKINALVLILPFYFLYQSLTPEFPSSWGAQKISTFEITLTPYDLDPPYMHDGHFTKDFMLVFNKGNIKNIRQAYLNIGNEALPLTMLQTEDEGILHGSKHAQEVHAIAPSTLKLEHKAWLTIETWQGEQHITSWDLPPELLPK